MEIIIKCSDDCRGSKNVYGEPIKELVRCKDCRWYDKVDWCNKLRISGVKAVEETWFCAGGEREA